MPGRDPWEDKFTVKQFKQYSEETGLLQFYAVSGGLRTIRADDIIKIGKPIAGEAKFIGLSNAEIRGLGEYEREKKARGNRANPKVR